MARMIVDLSFIECSGTGLSYAACTQRIPALPGFTGRSCPSGQGVEIGHYLLQAGVVSRQHAIQLPGIDGLFAAPVRQHGDERRRVESRARRGEAAELFVVRGRSLVAEPQK